MDTTVNERDVILQAANPRVLPVSLPSNVTVPTGQVDGLPALSLNSKVLFLRASSLVFQVPKSGAAPTPSSINLTPLARNVSGAVVWTVVSGTATLTDDGNGGRNLTFANLGTDSATLKVTITDGGVTYSDTVTVVKLREGSDTLNVVLSNESHTIAADANGNASGYSGANTSVTIFSGVTDVTAQWSISKADGLGLTSSISSNVITVTDMQAGYVNSYVDITATKSGQPTLSKRFSLTKTRAGTNGNPGNPGNPGTRGNMDVIITGYGSWPDDNTASNAFTSATGYSPINRDRLTFATGNSNTITKFYSNGSWLPISAWINGNMVVDGTFSAGKIDAGVMTGQTYQSNSGTSAAVKINEGGSNTLRVYYNGNQTVGIGGFGNTTPAIDVNYSSSGMAALRVVNTANNFGASITGSQGLSVSASSSSGSGLFAHGGSTSGSAITIGSGGNGITQIGGGMNWLKGLNPADINAHSLGNSTYLWTAVYATSSTIITSDARTKTDVEPSDLSLNFILDLESVSYRQVVAENVVTDNFVEVQAARDVVDDFGDLLQFEAVVENQPIVTPRPGTRRHYGLIAQQVRAMLLKHGASDSAIWSLADKANPDSQQALRYEELIAPMIRAMQQMNDKIEALTAEVRSMK